jgi:hypothetical protein
LRECRCHPHRALLTFASLTVLAKVLLIAKIDQRVEAINRFDNHIAAAPAVTAIAPYSLYFSR